VSLGHGDKIACHKLRLLVGKTPDGAVGLDEADSEEIIKLRMEDVEIEKWLLVGSEQETVVEERNCNLVAGREHDEISLDFAAIAEADFVVGKFGDVGLDSDAAVTGELRQHRVHGRMG